MKKFREWISIRIVKSPRSIVLLSVLIANIVFIGVAAFTISCLSPSSAQNGGFGKSVFNTIIMYLGIGGIDTVVENVSQANVLLVLASIIIIVIGLVFFTYALIGYISEFISNFIVNADSGSKKLRISNHTVILNWNSRAVEIINDLLYKGTKEKVVVLAGKNKTDVKRDIDERLANTIDVEKSAIKAECASMSFKERISYAHKNRVKSRLIIITREGNTCSTKQLSDISIEQAKKVIILSTKDSEYFADSHTIKTLIQVAQMMESESSISDQQIVVEVEDEHTLALVEKIIKQKTQKGKCNIVPMPVNRILGYIFSQFTIMPELNMVYSTLFSFKGADLYVRPIESPLLLESEFISGCLAENKKAIPLTVMTGEDGRKNCYYFADNEHDVLSSESVSFNRDYHVLIRPDFAIEERHVIILGHNSKNEAMMEGFAAFNREWKRKDTSDVLDVTIIDDEASLKKRDYYKQYPWVKSVISAEINEQERICNAVSEFIKTHSRGGCMLILSDDTLSGADVDENALTYLVLVLDIISSYLEDNPEFDINSMDMIVEIVDPRNHDIVDNYNMKNVVISNRYVSKMIMQVGENKALFDFYKDILTYDEFDDTGERSKEIYIKRADMFFDEIPEPCNAAELIRAVYEASPEDNKSSILGYFNSDGKMILFSGDHTSISVVFLGNEKLILFSNH